MQDVLNISTLANVQNTVTVAPCYVAMFHDFLKVDQAQSQTMLDLHANSIANLAVRCWLGHIEAVFSVKTDLDEAMLTLLNHSAFRKTALSYFNATVFIDSLPLFMVSSVEKALASVGIKPIYSVK